MNFEPIKAFNFVFAIPWDVPKYISEYFGLTVESAYIDLLQKNGRISFREFIHTEENGLALIRMYLSGVIREFKVELLSEAGDPVRCYWFKGVKISSFNLSLGNTQFNVNDVTAPYIIEDVRNELYFKFDEIEVTAKDEHELPKGARLLTLDYRARTRQAEIIT